MTAVAGAGKGGQATVIDEMQTQLHVQQVRGTGGTQTLPASRTKTQGSFEALLQQQIQETQQTQETQQKQGINFSKHARARAEERGIELTPDLMDKLAGSVERAQEKGVRNILAFDATQAFIINVPCCRVITTMSQDEMKNNCFTNIDGAVLL